MKLMRHRVVGLEGVKEGKRSGRERRGTVKNMGEERREGGEQASTLDSSLNPW